MPTAHQGYFNKAGVQIPGTTTVMKAVNAGPPTDALCYWAAGLAKRGLNWKDERDRAGTLGTFIHDILENFPKPLPMNPGTFTPDEWKRVVAAYGAFAEWDAMVQPGLLHHEVQLVSELHQYGGCFDAVWRIGGDVVMGDHKTGKSASPKTWAMQLAAYRQLVEENGLVERGAIRRGLVLHYPEGKFRPVEIGEHQLAAGWDLFLTARRAYDQLGAFPK
jgi:hypothetical protein